MVDNGKNGKNSSFGEAVGLDRKLLAYALAGGAALVAPAQADIISYAGPTLSTLSGPIELDLNNDSVLDLLSWRPRAGIWCRILWTRMAS